jgi:hypothetical protein
MEVTQQVGRKVLLDLDTRYCGRSVLCAGTGCYKNGKGIPTITCWFVGCNFQCSHLGEMETFSAPAINTYLILPVTFIISISFASILNSPFFLVFLLSAVMRMFGNDSWKMNARYSRNSLLFLYPLFHLTHFQLDSFLLLLFIRSYTWSCSMLTKSPMSKQLL